MIVIVLLIIRAPSTVAKVACYDCYGISNEQGQFCSIDKLCLGETCYFSAQADGNWSSGCSIQAALRSTLYCSSNLDESSTTCKCTTDLCNDFQTVNKTIVTFWAEQNTLQTSLVLPKLSMSCIECGNVTIGDRSINIPCTEEHICHGDYCVTKRSLNPYSYCGTLWAGTSEARCFKNPGEEEQCVCVHDMCNFAISPLLSHEKSLLSMIDNNSSTANTPLTGKKCKNRIKISPNVQANYMGAKLGEIIRNGFGTEKSKEESLDEIDKTICE